MNNQEKELSAMQQLWIIAMFAHESAIAGKNEHLIVERRYFKKLSAIRKIQKFHNDLLEMLVSEGYLNVTGRQFYSLSDKARMYANDRYEYAKEFSWKQQHILYIANAALTENANIDG